MSTTVVATQTHSFHGNDMEVSIQPDKPFAVRLEAGASTLDDVVEPGEAANYTIPGAKTLTIRALQGIPFDFQWVDATEMPITLFKGQDVIEAVIPYSPTLEGGRRGSP